MDTTQIVQGITLNVLNWMLVSQIVFVLMLGGLAYNLWHAREFLPLIGSSKFNVKKLVVENSIRFLYCLSVSFVLALILNVIPDSAQFLGGLTGQNLVFSAVGLLAAGGFLAKTVFDSSEKVAIKDKPISS